MTVPKKQIDACETCRKRMDCKLYAEAVRMGATIDQCPEYRTDHSLTLEAFYV